MRVRVRVRVRVRARLPLLVRARLRFPLRPLGSCLLVQLRPLGGVGIDARAGSVGAALPSLPAALRSCPGSSAGRRLGPAGRSCRGSYSTGRPRRRWQQHWAGIAGSAQASSWQRAHGRAAGQRSGSRHNHS